MDPVVGLVAVAIAVPWYVLMEARTPGFLRHMVVDNHLYAFTRPRLPLEEEAAIGLLGVLALTLLAPVLALFALVTLAFAAASLGALPARAGLGGARPRLLDLAGRPGAERDTRLAACFGPPDRRVRRAPAVFQSCRSTA